jgi:hypothetical protein
VTPTLAVKTLTTALSTTSCKNSSTNSRTCCQTPVPFIISEWLVLRAHLLLLLIVYPSSFQEGCPLHCYTIYDTKTFLCYKWTLFVLQVCNQGPYSLLGLYGHLGPTYYGCCVVQGCSGLAILHPYCLRMWVSYDRVQATAQQRYGCQSPLYSLFIVLYGIVLCR